MDAANDVARFVSLTNCPADQAQFYLEANGGNFDRAVAMYYGALRGWCATGFV